MKDPKLALRVVDRFRAAHVAAKPLKGEKARDTLENAARKLNSLMWDVGKDKSTDYAVVRKTIQEVMNDITSVIFGIHLDSVKRHLTDKILPELRAASELTEVKKNIDVLQIGNLIQRASLFLGGAVEELKNNPDLEEQEALFSRFLDNVVPKGSDSLMAHYDRAIKLCEQLHDNTTNAKKKQFYGEVYQALRAVRHAQEGLIKAAAFAYKMLPKPR